MKLSGRSRYSGYTLVEILVVIAIIGLVVGISLGAFSIIQQKSQDKATKVRVDSISLELATLLREFPDDDYTSLLAGANGDVDSSIEVYKLLTGDENVNGLIDSDELAQPLAEKLLPPKEDALMTAADWQLTRVWVTDTYQIKDAFGEPLRLRLRDESGKGFVGEKNNSPVAFDLWSGGQDRQTGNSAIGTSDDLKDDVGNW